MKLHSFLMCVYSLVLAMIAFGLTIGIVKGEYSISPAIEASNRNSYEPESNSDGTKIVFTSNSDLLGECILDNQSEIWLYDTTSMTYTRITTPPNYHKLNYNPHISADGTKIVFRNEPNPSVWFKVSEFILYDTLQMTSTRIGTTTSAVNPGSFGLGINADGTKIAFEYDTDLPPNSSDIWLYDTTVMTYTHIIPNSYSPSLNADGTRIAFSSSNDFLNQGLPGTQWEIWLYDTTTMTYTRVTTALDVDRHSSSPRLSTDGTKIIFSSDSDFLHQGIQNDQYEVWLYDTTAMTYTRITTSSDFERDSRASDLNADGTRIVFESNSDFFNQGIDIKQSEIWLYETKGMTLTRITTSTGSSGIRQSSSPHLNLDGTKIVFSSDADFLNEGIEDDQFEIWMYDTMMKKLTRITTGSGNQCTIYLPIMLK